MGGRRLIRVLTLRRRVAQGHGRATTKRTSDEIVSFNLLNEPVSERAKVRESIDAWFDRWLAP